MKEIYLDNSATGQPFPEVVDAVTETLKKNYGNPSSLHRKGIEAEKILKKARKLTAEKLGVSSREIIFTSGGTEANNIAIQGIARKYKNRGNHLITTLLEHPAVLKVFRYLEENGFKVSYLKPDKDGLIPLASLKKAMTEDTILVSMMHVNNEIGSIQPIARAGEIIKEKNPLTFFHVDAVQSFSKVYLRPADWKVDLLSLSGHKIHGPKGVGALYIKDGLEIPPLFYGGGQEKDIRSGTENTPGIAGFLAAMKSLPFLDKREKLDPEIKELRDYFIDKLEKNREKLPEFQINTVPELAAPQIINLSFPGFRGEVIVHSLEKEGIYISTGSACSSRKKDKNKTLSAIGLSDDMINGTIRISLSRLTEKKEIDYTIEKMIEELDYLSI